MDSKRNNRGQFVVGSFKDYTGLKKNRLTFIKLDHIHVQPNGGKVPYWLCRCDCGSEKVIAAKDVYGGHTQSCGCYQKEVASKVNSTHKKTETRLYRIWGNMKKRCDNPNNQKFQNYGKRGIKICTAWRSFSSFYCWAIENGYAENLTIERIDVNDNYKPENCKWILASEQANNKTTTHYFEIGEKKYTTNELCEIYGLAPKTILARYYRGDRGERLIRPLRTRIR